MPVQTNATDIGSYRLASNPSVYQPALSNNFEFVVTDIDNLRRAYEGTLIPNAQEVLRFSVDTASVPHFTQDVITIRRGNSVIKFAGVPTFEGGRLVVNDYIGAETDSDIIDRSNEEGHIRGRFSSENQPIRNPSIRKLRHLDDEVDDEVDING